MFKLKWPPADAFYRQPFWNPPGLYDFSAPGTVHYLPVPPTYKEGVPSTSGRWVQHTRASIVKLPYFAKRELLARFECEEILHHVAWILGIDKPFIGGVTYKDFIDHYGNFALRILHELVGQKPRVCPYPKESMLLLYRLRRCFPPYVEDVNPLHLLSSYQEPVNQDELYSIGELHEHLFLGFKGRGIITSRLQNRAIIKSTATLEYTGREGGFNKTVMVLSRNPVDTGIFIPKKPRFYSPIGSDIASYSARDRKMFMSAFYNSVFLMENLNRKPVLYVSVLNERSLKKRIPALAEGFCSVLALSVSDIGKTIQERLFPLTRGTRVIMRHVPGSIYLSGDYKSSTNYIWWEAIMISYFHIFRQAGLSSEQMDLYMRIVDFLCKTHLFFCSVEDREKYRSIFYLRTEVIHPRMGFDSYSYYKKNGPCSAIVCKQVATGSPFGSFVHDFCVPPSLKEILEGLNGFLVGGDSFLSTRGVAMCYSLAAPALHIIGAIPHWKFRDLEFKITGDDNASAHRPVKNVGTRKNPKLIKSDPLESIRLLEAEKIKTGMIPHDLQKSANGPLGFLLAERFFHVVEGEKNLVELKNFPIRILFPEKHTDWHCITMPEAALKNFKEVPCPNVRLRIAGYVYWKYKPLYEKIRSLNISIGGQNGLFPMLPEERGCVNSSDKASRGEVFKLPSLAGPGWPEDQLYGILYPSCSIPIEDEDGYNLGTDRFLSISDLSDRLRPFSPASPYDLDHLHHPGYEFPLIPTLRSNVEAILNPYVKKNARSCWNFDYQSNSEGTTFMDGLYLSSILDLPEEELSHNDRRIISLHHSGLLGYAPSKPQPSVHRVDDPRSIEFSDSSERKEYCRALMMKRSHETDAGVLTHGELVSHVPLHAPISIWSANFSCTPPLGTSLRELSKCSTHWFLDMANLFPDSFREHHPVLSVQGYIDALGEPCLDDSDTVTYFVLERPGRSVCKSITPGGRLFSDRFHHSLNVTVQRNFVVLPSRISGNAGADAEFRSVSRFIRNENPEARIYYSSHDSDWRVHAQQIKSRYRTFN